MDNFELIDNLFQITALLIAMLFACILAIRYGKRRFIVLACDHGCFLLGTTFFTLHLSIMGDIPQIFYVSDIAWIAAYLFLLLLMLLRFESSGQKAEFKLLPSVVFIFICSAAIYTEMLGPSKFMSLCIGIIGGATVYLAICMAADDVKRGEGIHPVNIMVTARIFLQIMLYFVSDYMSDFTDFNLYFAVDIVMTLNMVVLGYFVRKEVIADDQY